VTVESRSVEALRARTREVLEHNARIGVRAPDFGSDKTWLNVSRPLSREDLAGSLVLIDFWTFCCINCMHVLPDLEFLERKYAGKGLVVVGCHSAKFPNEADDERVREAVLRERIEHPVVVDRDFDAWRRFAIRAWPTLVLVSPDGRILAQLSGEGQRAVLDVMIGEALALYAESGALGPRELPLRLERERALPRELEFPGRVLADAAHERLYIADSGHHRILVTDPDGRFLAQIGTGEPGFADGGAGEARFRGPQGMTLLDGALIVADTLNHAIRRVDPATGAVETVAGTGEQGYERKRAMPAREASLSSPWDVRAVEGRVVVAMAGLHQLWVLDLASSTVAPIAGDGAEERRDGPVEGSAFAQPSGLALHGRTVLVADSESSSIRALDLDEKVVRTIAGGHPEPRNLFHFGDEEGEGLGRRFQHPLAVEIDPTVEPERALAYVADSYNHRIKIVDPDSGAVSLYAGAGASGFEDGPVESARFSEPQGLSIAGSKLYVADTNNHAIRVIDLEQHEVRTLELRGVPIPRGELRAAAIDASPLPLLPSTVVHPPLKRRLANGDATLELRLSLAEGEKLADGAPSQFRVLREAGLVAAKQVAGPITSDPTLVELGVAGSGLLRVQALAYVCDPNGLCSLRSHEWRVEVEEHERAGRKLALESS
jgi:thiol-disulfide isomerase/thioredoxin